MNSDSIALSLIMGNGQSNYTHADTSHDISMTSYDYDSLVIVENPALQPLPGNQQDHREQCFKLVRTQQELIQLLEQEVHKQAAEIRNLREKNQILLSSVSKMKLHKETAELQLQSQVSDLTEKTKTLEQSYKVLKQENGTLKQQNKLLQERNSKTTSAAGPLTDNARRPSPLGQNRRTDTMTRPQHPTTPPTQSMCYVPKVPKIRNNVVTIFRYGKNLELAEPSSTFTSWVGDMVGSHNINMKTEEYIPESHQPVALNKSRDGILIVFGLKTSRLGTDMDSAFAKINPVGFAHVLLVVMHHQAPHVRLTTPSAELLNYDTIKSNKIREVVDCLFWGQQGLYKVQVNTEAAQQVAYFIKEHLPY